MRFEWDEEKAASNLAKHGVNFPAAATVFADPNHILFVDAVIDGEERWHVIGAVPATLLLLTVVHTYRDNEEIVRIISAREATRKEVKRYAKNLE
jgi:uncharacterized DUF497 family protein